MRKEKKNDGKVKKSDRLKEEQPSRSKRIVDVERENRKTRKHAAKQERETRRKERRKHSPRFIGAM